MTKQPYIFFATALCLLVNTAALAQTKPTANQETHPRGMAFPSLPPGVGRTQAQQVPVVSRPLFGNLVVTPVQQAIVTQALEQLQGQGSNPAQPMVIDDEKPEDNPVTIIEIDDENPEEENTLTSPSNLPPPPPGGQGGTIKTAAAIKIPLSLDSLCRHQNGLSDGLKKQFERLENQLKKLKETLDKGALKLTTTTTTNDTAAAMPKEWIQPTRKLMQALFDLMDSIPEGTDDEYYGLLKAWSVLITDKKIKTTYSTQAIAVSRAKLILLTLAIITEELHPNPNGLTHLKKLLKRIHRETGIDPYERLIKPEGTGYSTSTSNKILTQNKLQTWSESFISSRFFQKNKNAREKLELWNQSLLKKIEIHNKNNILSKERDCIQLLPAGECLLTAIIQSLQELMLEDDWLRPATRGAFYDEILNYCIQIINESHLYRTLTTLSQTITLIELLWLGKDAQNLKVKEFCNRIISLFQKIFLSQMRNLAQFQRCQLNNSSPASDIQKAIRESMLKKLPEHARGPQSPCPILVPQSQQKETEVEEQEEVKPSSVIELNPNALNQTLPSIPSGGDPQPQIIEIDGDDDDNPPPPPQAPMNQTLNENPSDGQAVPDWRSISFNFKS
jgi:hypothetical protein